NFGNQPAVEVNRPPGSFHLARQGSIYSLTFDELQNTMGSIGKDFGSMNMDELLKSIWNAEENQTSVNNIVANGGGGDNGGGGGIIQRQGSLTLPRTLSQKTVDQVWKDISKEFSGFGQPNLPQRQQTLGEMTLEQFLFKAGVVREEPELVSKPNDTGLFCNLPNFQNNPVFSPVGLQGVGRTNGLHAPTNGFQSNNNMPLNDNGVRSTQSQPKSQQLFPMNMGLAVPGGVTVGSPAVSSDDIGKNNGDTSSVSPSPYEFSGIVRGRKSGAVDKVVERRQRRMIKNRESAARSRARKQAYTMELEAEVAKLKVENQELKRKAEMIETQQNQVMEMMSTQPGAKRRYLRRTQSGQW
ncbi:ABSCISIC ACID-INSENSITIVE 5-like protein 5, partial [Bidens hawaiensis]|uniref:ABSCISIC ACID-INSENSITIVE 5-like protein 5 n=1 Tax=Bidens hawaiensis TaxID=980011 RepID=UPI0040496D0F